MPLDDGSAERGGGGTARNVLGGQLESCSIAPDDRVLPQRLLRHRAEDVGSHTVCVVMTAEFLAFSKAARQRSLDADAGIRLCRPEAGRPLVPVRAALAGGAEAGQAPRVVLRATHEGALAYCALADLKRHAIDLS